MLRSACVLVLVLAACRTPVETHFPLTGTPEFLREATQRAASTLGWPQRGDAVDAPNGELLVQPRAGLLTLSAPRTSLGDATLLASTTKLELEGRKGTVLTPRLLPLSVALNVLLPIAGTLYLGPNDPLATAQGASFGIKLAYVALMDLLAVEMVWLSQTATNSPLGRGLFIGGAIFTAVFNRVMALLIDTKLINSRNDFAQRNVPLPTADDITPAR